MMLECEDTSLQVLRAKEVPKTITICDSRFCDLRALSALPEHMLNLYLTMGPTYTLMKNGEPVAAAGVLLGQPGIGTAWAFIPDYVKTLPVALHRTTLHCLSKIIREHNLRRVDYIVDPLDLPAVKWAARLGFEYEGTLRRFFEDGHDAWLCAWVK